jgi:hypothetical protein
MRGGRGANRSVGVKARRLVFFLCLFLCPRNTRTPRQTCARAERAAELKPKRAPAKGSTRTEKRAGGTTRAGRGGGARGKGRNRGVFLAARACVFFSSAGDGLYSLRVGGSARDWPRARDTRGPDCTRSLRSRPMQAIGRRAGIGKGEGEGPGVRRKQEPEGRGRGGRFFFFLSETGNSPATCGLRFVKCVFNACGCGSGVRECCVVLARQGKGKTARAC